MALNPAMEARLQRWAEAVTIGDASGYATVCTLHESWSPPAAGQRPSLKVSATSDVRETHQAIGMLSVRLRNAVVVRYCFGGTLAEQAQRLECQPDTVLDRVERAHRALAAVLQGFCNIQQPG